MNISELVDHVAAEGKMTKAQAKAVIDSVLGGIRASAMKGQETSLPGFGKFKVQNKPARTGRNPRTGEAVRIAASRKLVFQAAKALKDAL
jgi:DNA-binding protein HU-beta